MEGQRRRLPPWRQQDIMATDTAAAPFRWSDEARRQTERRHWQYDPAHDGEAGVSVLPSEAHHPAL